jgi:hypothetical protein
VRGPHKRSTTDGTKSRGNNIGSMLATLILYARLLQEYSNFLAELSGNTEALDLLSMLVGSLKVVDTGNRDLN